MALGTRRRTARRTADPTAAEFGSGPDAVVSRLFEGVLRSARNHLCRATEPLAAEIWASGLLAVWDSTAGPSLLDPVDRNQDAFGEALVRYAGFQATPEAVAVLLGVAAVAPTPLATKARTAAVGIHRMGVPAPPWAETVGRAVPTEAWIGTDAYGDQDIVIIGFTYPGPVAEGHTLCVLVDHNAAGIAKDAYLAADLATTLTRWQEAEANGITLRPIPLAEASGRLADALVASEFHSAGGENERLSELRALLCARQALLPPGERIGLPELAGAARERLVAEFLESPEAAELLFEPSVVEICHRLVAYRCDYGDGDPLRWSPTLVGWCLLEHFPRCATGGDLDEHDLALVPEVLVAWTRFAGRRRGLAPDVLGRTLAAIQVCRGDFALAITGEAGDTP